MHDVNPQETLLKLVRVIDKAIGMERNAQIFYRNAAQKVESVEGKKMFQWLASFESGHEARLMIRRKELFAHPSMEAIPQYAIDEVAELSEARPIELPESPSDIDVLMIGIQNEVTAQSYYQLKAQYMSDDSLKNTFERMAQEEERHVRILSEQLKHLQVEEFWLDLAAFDEARK
jgi:rubrerythrin